MDILPLFPLEFSLRRLILNAMAARPFILSRLDTHASRAFAIDPTDCPFSFILSFPDGSPSLRLVRSLANERCDARVAAPLLLLVGMLDGTYDGDALFFSRDLVIEGDTEAVLALRNAIEDAELDPATVAGLPRNLKQPFNDGVNLALGQLRRLLDAPKPTGTPRKASH